MRDPRVAGYVSAIHPAGEKLFEPFRTVVDHVLNGGPLVEEAVFLRIPLCAHLWRTLDEDSEKHLDPQDRPKVGQLLALARWVLGLVREDRRRLVVAGSPGFEDAVGKLLGRFQRNRDLSVFLGGLQVDPRNSVVEHSEFAHRPDRHSWPV